MIQGRSDRSVVVGIASILSALIWLGPAHAASDPPFPIAATSAREMALGIAFDGTNFLVGIQGCAGCTTGKSDDITAQLVTPSGTLVGDRIAIGRSGGVPEVAFDGTNYLLTWTDPWDVLYGQFITPLGGLLGSPFAISTLGIDNTPASVAYGGGEYFVAYAKQVSGAVALYARPISPAGVLGSERVVSAAAVQAQNVAFDGSRFVVVWIDGGGVVKGRTADASGTMAPEFTIAGSGQAAGMMVAIAWDGAHYLVAWEHPVGGAQELHGQRVDSSGTLVGSPMTIVSAPAVPSFPFLAFDGTNFLLTWTDARNDPDWSCTSAEGTCLDIYGRFIATSGALVGSEFPVTTAAGNQFINPVLFGGGKYLVGWTSGDSIDGTIGDVWGTFVAPLDTAPSVTTHPSNQTVAAGATASFSAAASGSPAPSVQWQASTDSGSTFTNISGATAGTYSFVAGAADNGTQFRAVFTNSAGSATSNAATLRVPLPTTMSLDSPASGSIVGRTFAIQGWALNRSASSGTGVDAIHVYAFPADGSAAIFLGVATYGVSRPDVGTIFGAQFTNSGFTLTSGASLSPGGYTIVAYAHNALTSSFDAAKSATITVPSPISAPLDFIDAPAAGSSVNGSFQVFGWSADTGAASGTGIDAVYVHAFESGSATPIWLGVATYGDARGDVGAVFGSQFTNSGYHLSVNAKLLAPGTYTLVVYSHSTVSGAFTRVSQTFTRAAGTVMSVDAPSAGATVTRPFVLGGWAIDRDASSGPGVDAVHAWAYPSTGGAAIFVGAASVGGTRGDVGAIYGSQFTPSGYTMAVATGSLAAGTYSLAVYAHSTVTDTFSQVRTLTITVQ